MSRDVFDIHADDVSHWDDDGGERADRQAVERCVTDLPTGRLGTLRGGRPLCLATASVRDAAGTHVLTAMLGPRTGLRSSWAKAAAPIEARRASG